MDRWTLPATILCSIALHLALLLPFFVRATAGTSSPALADALVIDAESPLIPPDQDPFAPGIERSQAVTLTWIGHEEYVAHMARLAEIEQAAFTPEPGGGEAAAVAQAASEMSSDDAAPFEEAAAESESLHAEMDPESVLVLTQRVLEMLTMSDATRETPERSQPATDGDEGSEAAESPSRDEGESEGESPSEEADAPEEEGEAPGPNEVGEIRDMESEATSVLDVRRDQLDPGRPIAREGLELFPRQPVFTMLTRMTALPRNPIVEIGFDREGIPVLATIVRSSGNTSVDDAVRSSLYRWRARGEALKDLPPEESARIRIRIVLNPYARE